MRDAECSLREETKLLYGESLGMVNSNKEVRKGGKKSNLMQPENFLRFYSNTFFSDQFLEFLRDVCAWSSSRAALSCAVDAQRILIGCSFHQPQQ